MGANSPMQLHPSAKAPTLINRQRDRTPSSSSADISFFRLQWAQRWTYIISGESWSKEDPHESNECYGSSIYWQKNGSSKGRARQVGGFQQGQVPYCNGNCEA